MKLTSISVFILLLLALLCVPAFADEDSEDESDDEDKDAELEKKIEALEKRVKELEKAEKRAENHVGSLAWEQDRDYIWLPNGWTWSIHGEFRGRAIIEANTVNAYTNYGGERIYAYDPRSTFSNDYGWWDQRLQVRSVFNFGDTADLIAKIQVGDSVWGSRARLWGDDGEGKFDKVTIMFRELWTRVDLAPIPIFLEFGRMPWELGNRLILGNEYDGARTYYRHKYTEIGFGAFRQYEGENYEMVMATNDDEDTFVAWWDIMPNPYHTLSLFGYLNDLKVTAKPNSIDPQSPLWMLNNFEQDEYTMQESQLWNVGTAWKGQFKNLTLNLEYDHQFGTLFASDRADYSRDINFEGYGAIAKLDWLIKGVDYIIITTGYGSGDDPDTWDMEGYFGPDNDFGIKEEGIYEYRDRGYFAVYEHLSPGAGVPGKLREDLGSGGIENTIFANLAWDSNFQANHHYYLSVGYIQAARENPKTKDDKIGVEVDARIDYLFSNNVIFSIYGGHLFVFGEYFRENAHDAAQLVFEWKLLW